MARKASQAIKEQMKLKEKLASDHNKLEQGRAAIENSKEEEEGGAV